MTRARGSPQRRAPRRSTRVSAFKQLQSDEPGLLRSRLLTSTALVAASMSLSGPAAAGPQQGTVAAGQVSISQSGASTTITQSTGKAIINWQSFSIGASESVQFEQPGRSSVTLNRVQGPASSQIFGSLNANGQIFLVNPNGVLFGQGASVNVGGLVATTSGISDQNFMAGNYAFNQPSSNPNAMVVNQGTINVARGGYAALSAAAVQNSGAINATLGTVVLGGAPAFTVDFTGDHLLSYQITQPVGQTPVDANGNPVAALVSNSGAIAANGGRVVMAASAAKGVIDNVINLTGVVQANTIRKENGVVVIGNVDLDGGANGNVLVSGQLSASGGVNLTGGAISVSGGPVTIASGGTVSANGTAGGQVTLNAGTVVNNAGSIDVSGQSGGAITVNAAVAINQGSLKADGSATTGGNIAVNVASNYVDTQGSTLSAQGAQQGGQIALTGAANSALFASGAMTATSSAGIGGTATLTATTVNLMAAQIDVSGATGGGTILVGGGPHGAGALAHATTTYVNPATILKANALGAGNGGTVVVWSDVSSVMQGSLYARGGGSGGNGGTIEVSSKGTATISGITDAGAPLGKAGVLLVDPQDIVITASGSSQFNFTDPFAGQTDGFGTNPVLTLSTGNVVITAPNTAIGAATSAGAAYLFNGATGGLISTLTGSQTYDNVGAGGVTALPNGNYVVISSNWANGSATSAGAVTWGSGTTGVSGVVSAANSLVGSHTNDNVGAGGVTALPNGNYVVISPYWTNNGAATNAGAVTWGNGTTGTTGVVSAANSLVGSQTNDQVGANYVNANSQLISALTLLSNGNYVVSSPFWANGAATQAGAVTWGSGTAGVSGAVSAANSLVGSQTNDRSAITTAPRPAFPAWWHCRTATMLSAVRPGRTARRRTPAQ